MYSKTLFATCLLLAATNGVVLDRPSSARTVPMVVKETKVQNLAGTQKPAKMDVVEVTTTAEVDVPKRPFTTMEPREFTRIPSLDSLFQDLKSASDVKSPQELEMDSKLDNVLDSLDFESKVDDVIDNIDFGFADIKEANDDLEKELIKGEQKLQNK